MSVVRRPHRVLPAIATAGLLLGGCLSAFADGASKWKPSDGKPTCSPGPLVVVDATIAVTGLYLLAAAAGGETCGVAGCELVLYARGVGGLFLGGGGAISTGIGVEKIFTCERANRRWREAVAAEHRAAERETLEVTTDVALAELGRDTGSVVDRYGDTLILRAPTVEVCAAPEWRERLAAHRAALAARGVTRIACRVGAAEIWSGRLED